MARCFGTCHKAVDSKLAIYLRRTLLNLQPKEKVLDHSNAKYLKRWVKAGILVRNTSSNYDFSSPLAKRYFSIWLRDSPFDETDACVDAGGTR